MAKLKFNRVRYGVVIVFVVGLGGCGVSPSNHVRYGEDPRYEDKNVAYRTTYYFRVFDYCRGSSNDMYSAIPATDSLYRFKMTGKSKTFFNDIRFESGTLKSWQIDPFGARVEYDENLGRHRFVSVEETEQLAKQKQAWKDYERIRKEYIQLKNEQVSTATLAEIPKITPSLALALKKSDSIKNDKLSNNIGTGIDAVIASNAKWVNEFKTEFTSLAKQQLALHTEASNEALAAALKDQVLQWFTKDVVKQLVESINASNQPLFAKMGKKDDAQLDAWQDYVLNFIPADKIDYSTAPDEIGLAEFDNSELASNFIDAKAGIKTQWIAAITTPDFEHSLIDKSNNDKVVRAENLLKSYLAKYEELLNNKEIKEVAEFEEAMGEVADAEADKQKDQEKLENATAKVDAAEEGKQVAQQKLDDTAANADATETEKQTAQQDLDTAIEAVNSAEADKQTAQEGLDAATKAADDAEAKKENKEDARDQAVAKELNTWFKQELIAFVKTVLSSPVNLAQNINELPEVTSYDVGGDNLLVTANTSNILDRLAADLETITNTAERQIFAAEHEFASTLTVLSAAMDAKLREATGVSGVSRNDLDSLKTAGASPEAINCKQVNTRKGFQILGPEGWRTFNPDDRLIMAMYSDNKPITEVLKQVSEKVVEAQQDTQGQLLNLTKAELRLSHAKNTMQAQRNAVEEADNASSKAQVCQLITQMATALDASTTDLSEAGVSCDD